MSLGNLIADLLEKRDTLVLRLSSEDTELLIDDFVDSISTPVKEYRVEHKISNDELGLISFR